MRLNVQLSCFCGFETGSHTVVQAGLELSQSSSCSSWLLTGISSVQLYKHIHALHATETCPNPFSNTQHWKPLQKCLNRGSVQSKGRGEVSKGPGCVVPSWLWQWYPLPLSPEHSRADSTGHTDRSSNAHTKSNKDKPPQPGQSLCLPHSFLTGC